MKSIVESINESMRLNESQVKSLLVINSHSNPSEVYVMGNPDKKLVNMLERNYDCNYDEYDVESPFVEICANDEHIDVYSNKKIKNKQQWVAAIANNIKSEIENFKKEDTVYDEINVPAICLFSDDDEYYMGTSIFDDYEVEDLDKLNVKKSAEDLITAWVEESFVDGDSADGRVVIDAQKQQVVIPGGLNIHFIDDPEELRMFTGYEE